MSLEPGHKLAHYEIVEPIGKGGMGEVFRARDTKLDRDVAIKILPAEFANDEERLARFEREAKLLASLNHPNIAGIFGFEEQDGVHALALELVEGPTLAERIEQGKIPTEEAVAIAMQISEALEAGHEAGVIHRDLKPANIKVKEDGTVKVLDYGLAKALEEDHATNAGFELSQSPTLTRQGTQVGVILGTAAYMSPEQARGKPVDKRADIWAFGAVVYEMLTGTKAFPGDDAAETLAAVINREPNWTALPSGIPSRLVELVRRCLEKDPRNRRRDMGDVRIDLAHQDETPIRARSLPRLTWLVAAVSTMVAGLLVWGFRAPSPVEGNVVRFEIAEDSIIGPAARQALSISPDGRRVAYASGFRGLLVRDLDTMESHVVPGTEGIRTPEPFLSPDGSWIGFHRDGRLQKVSVRGGEPITIAESEAPIGVSWVDEDTVIFGQGAGGIHRVKADGGEPDVLIEVDAEQGQRAQYPTMLPDGKTVLFTLMNGSDDTSQVVAQSVGGEERKVLATGANARYLPPGFLLFGVGTSLMAVRFDPKRLEVTGDPIPVIFDARLQNGILRYDVSPTGTLIYQRTFVRDSSLAWLDRSGEMAPWTMEAGTYRLPRISPDGRSVVAILDDDLWVYQVEDAQWSRLTSSGTVDRVEWSADGGSVFFSASLEGVVQVFEQVVEASEVRRQVTDGANPKLLDSVSPDGTQVLFTERFETSRTNLMSLDLEGSQEPRPLVESSFLDRVGKFSPDGGWIAYVSNDRGRRHIYLRPADGAGESILVSPGEGPVWSPDGRELLFVHEDVLMSADVNTTERARVSPPRVLLDARLYDLQLTTNGPQPNYDVTPDGERFVVVRGQDQTVPIQVVVNWTSELERLLAGN